MTRLTDEQVAALDSALAMRGGVLYDYFRALLDERAALRARAKELKAIGDDYVRQSDAHADAMQEKLDALQRHCARLREALLALSRERQFGSCWCNTAAGLYCVAQEQCNRARAALAEDQPPTSGSE